MAKDEEFRKELGGCKTRADQHQFAQGAGFEFTGDEMKTAGSELQDADLDVISGGSCCGQTCESEIARAMTSNIARCSLQKRTREYSRRLQAGTAPNRLGENERSREPPTRIYSGCFRVFQPLPVFWE